MPSGVCLACAPVLGPALGVEAYRLPGMSLRTRLTWMDRRKAQALYFCDVRKHKEKQSPESRPGEEKRARGSLTDVGSTSSRPTGVSCWDLKAGPAVWAPSSLS